MKLIFFSFIFMFSLSAQAYSLGYGSYDNDSRFAEIQRKQDCILRQQEAQATYTRCLQDCQERKERQRRIGFGYISSSCYCSQPLSSGCY